MGKFNITDYKIKANGIGQHVVDFGGSGETILAVHGFAANARYWDAYAEQLVDNYHVIAVDVRGRGDSDKPVDGYYDWYQYSEDIVALLDVLGLTKVIWMGHSMGGAIGVVFANMFPERLSRLIEVDCGCDMYPEVLQALIPTFEKIGFVYPDYWEYLEDNKANNLLKDWNIYMERYFWHHVHHNDDGTVVGKCPRHAALSKNVRQVELDKINKNIKVPTLLLQAPLGLTMSDDSPLPILAEEKALELVKYLPAGSKYISISGANHHTIVFAKYKEVCAEIIEFLENTKASNI